MNKTKRIEEFEPFGSPEGSRVGLEDISSKFVTFKGSAWGGLATSDDDLTARVIVGRKGSGKTVYLRRLRAYASKQEDLYADDIHVDLPTTENVIKFCHFFNENVLTEKWMLLWRRAIFLSLISHLMHNPGLRDKDKFKYRNLENLISLKKSVVRKFNASLSVYSQVSEIIYNNDTRNEITKYLDDPQWSEVESLVAEIIRDIPPICFYIDAVDEEFAHAPMYWHRCQKGLFYQTMRLLRDSKLGGRLHIFICVRDIVLSSVYQSEHATRYRGEPYIRFLNWDKKSINHFLSQKLKMVGNEFFISGKRGSGDVKSWLGIKEIYNDKRDIHEPIEQYLLRHTRLLPRDIIVLGNSLCNEIVKHGTFEDDYQIEALIRSTISESSNFFGNEQLKICGNQIASNRTPMNAALYQYSDFYTANKEHINGISDDLRKLILHIGKECFSNSELKESREYAHKLFGEDVHPFSVLWQNDLIGYNNSRAPTNYQKIDFYSASPINDFRISFEKDNYVFHPCIIDSVKINSVGNVPFGY